MDRCPRGFEPHFWQRILSQVVWNHGLCWILTWKVLCPVYICLIQSAVLALSWKKHFFKQRRQKLVSNTIEIGRFWTLKCSLEIHLMRKWGVSFIFFFMTQNSPVNHRHQMAKAEWEKAEVLGDILVYWALIFGCSLYFPHILWKTPSCNVSFELIDLRVNTGS